MSVLHVEMSDSGADIRLDFDLAVLQLFKDIYQACIDARHLDSANSQ